MGNQYYHYFGLPKIRISWAHTTKSCLCLILYKASEYQQKFTESYELPLLILQITFFSIQNLPRQSANAEAFAEAHLHFMVFASAIEMPRQLNSQKFFLKNSFPRTKKEFLCKRKNDFFHKKTFIQGTNYSCASIFIIHTFISYIFNSLFYLLCYALNKVIDVIHFFLSKQIFLLLKSLQYALN